MAETIQLIMRLNIAMPSMVMENVD
jgi:hypothetical protein